MIKAINKDGIISVFSDTVWNLMSTNKNGYREITDTLDVVVPDKIIEFKAKRSAELTTEDSTPIAQEMPIVEFKKHKSDAAAEMGIMREYLKSKGVKFHHMLGYDKLKELYDANHK